MKAVILAGGLGSRSRPLTFSIPKPLLPVGEKAILQIIIEQLSAAGIREIVLALGYHAELVQAFCGDGSRFGVSVSYVKETVPLGTAGPLSLLRDRVASDEHFLLMNGDILTKMDFRAFVDANRKENADLMVGYTQHVYRSPFGVLTIDGGCIKDIVEKPTQEYAISAGIYALKGSTLAWVPDGEFFTVPDLIRRLNSEGKKVGAYYIKDCWVGLESIAHFEEACKELNNAPVEPDAIEVDR
jgi:NDP-sugar pyrophosphorylase family protein